MSRIGPQRGVLIRCWLHSPRRTCIHNHKAHDHSWWLDWKTTGWLRHYLNWVSPRWYCCSYGVNSTSETWWQISNICSVVGIKDHSLSLKTNQIALGKHMFSTQIRSKQVILRAKLHIFNATAALAPFLCFTMWLWYLFLWLDVKGLLLLSFTVLFLVYSLNKKDPPNFPPGPPALPLLGNVFSIESKQPHIYLTKVRQHDHIFLLWSAVFFYSENSTKTSAKCI